MTKPLYFYNGTTFELVGPTTPQSPIAYQTSAPTGPATGDLWIDSDGDVDTYNRQLTRYYFVATAAQTTISGVDANSLTLAYVAGSEAVYVNGALQVRGQDYTATDGTSVVLSSGLAVNDVVEIFAYTAFTVANAYTKSETDGIAAAAAGLRMVVPTSVAVGSGSGSVDAIGNVTFTTASSISLNGCFSSVYDVYKIVITLTASSGNPTLTLRVRIGSTDKTAADYYFGGFNNSIGGASLGQYRGNAATAFTVGDISSAQAARYFTIMDMANPFNTTATKATYQGHYGNASDFFAYGVGGMIADSTSYDGFTLISSTGTFTGTIRVYGYKD
jgi:hypothetical protein